MDIIAQYDGWWLERVGGFLFVYSPCGNYSASLSAAINEGELTMEGDGEYGDTVTVPSGVIKAFEGMQE